MKASIITIGDEILIGQIVDTNSAWIAEELNNLGVDIYRIISISDSKDEIIKVLNENTDTSDLIILTGGLGPTNDDITKTVLNEYFGGNLVLHEATLDHINTLFKLRGINVNELNKSQALLPDNCDILPNIHGTAPGMWFEKGKKIVVSVPGVPYEMKAIISEYVLPKLKSRFDLPVIIHKTVLTQGIAESILAEKLSEWENNISQNIKVAYLPSPGKVRIRLSVKGNDKDMLNKVLEENTELLKSLIGEYIFGFDDDALESIIGKLLVREGKTLSTAESCTGGAVASIITSVSGSSKYFKGSVVAYDNMLKINTLNVKGEDILNFGAVSEQVVTQMANGVRNLFNTNYAIATSGVAGPTGGTPEKPVGTVWIAVASEEKTIAKKFMFGDHRGRNITKSVFTSLNMLRKLLE